MRHGSGDSSKNEYHRNFSTKAKREADFAGNHARGYNSRRYTFDIFFTTWRNNRAGDSRRKRIKRTKRMMESSLCLSLSLSFSLSLSLSLYVQNLPIGLVVGPAANVDLLLRSTCLKCFNRHGLYDVATLRRANSIHLSVDCCLLLCTSFRANSFVLPPNATFIDLYKGSRSVIAHNHTRGRYKRESADAHFFPSLKRVSSLDSLRSICLVFSLSFPEAASDVLLKRRH